MDAVLTSLMQLIAAAWELTVALLFLIVPWTPLLGYVAFWLFAVDWVKLRPVLVRGGWIAILLIDFAAVLIWGLIAPPPTGYHYLLGLTVTNFVGKFTYVAALTVIMLLSGSAQLAGLCGTWAAFPEPASDDGHGHDHHDAGHGHDGQIAHAH